MDYTIFVQNVSSRCKSMGVSPSFACRESGAGQSLIDNIKKGSAPSVEKIYMLAKYLGCTVSDLLGENKEDWFVASIDIPPQDTLDDVISAAEIMLPSSIQTIKEMIISRSGSPLPDREGPYSLTIDARLQYPAHKSESKAKGPVTLSTEGKPDIIVKFNALSSEDRDEVLAIIEMKLAKQSYKEKPH